MGLAELHKTESSTKNNHYILAETEYFSIPAVLKCTTKVNKRFVESN